MPDTEVTETQPEETTEVAETQTEVKPEPAKAQPGKVHAMSSRAIADVRKEARNAGRKEARQEADRLARAAGYSNHDDMVEAAKRAKRGAKDGQKVEAKAQGDVAAMQARAEAAEGRVKVLLQKLARMAKETKRAVRAKRAIEAEMELRVAATKHGVRDVDYAVHLLQRKLANSSLDEQRAFNEDDYFGKELKKTHAHLYQATTAPATTSPATKEPAPAPKPKDTIDPEVKDQQVDARTLPPNEYRKLLDKYNLRDPATATY